MKAQNLIAAIAAALLTAASLGAVTYNTAIRSTPAPIHTYHHVSHNVPVTELAPVQVSPTAAERRQAALLPHAVALGPVTTGSTLADAGQRDAFRVASSELVMPYYSFGNTLGGTNKE